MIDEEEFIKKHPDFVDTITTIVCPTDQCDKKFTGTAAEILIDISGHYGKYHKNG